MGFKTTLESDTITRAFPLDETKHSAFFSSLLRAGRQYTGKGLNCVLAVLMLSDGVVFLK